MGPASGDSAEQQKEVVQEEDREEVFTVELRRGPHGLGLALVDGTVCAGLLELGLLSGRFHILLKYTTQLQVAERLSPLFTAAC